MTEKEEKEILIKIATALIIKHSPNPNNGPSGIGYSFKNLVQNSCEKAKIVVNSFKLDFLNY